MRCLARENFVSLTTFTEPVYRHESTKVLHCRVNDFLFMVRKEAQRKGKI